MLKIIPLPNKIENLDETKSFKIASNSSISYSDSIKVAITDFLSYIKNNFSLNITKNVDKADISFIFNEKIPCEGYIIEISENSVIIEYSDKGGALYAVQTLKQMSSAYKLCLPLCRISDKPFNKYRGFMLDNGRYFFPTEDVLKCVDIMVMNKLNVLHWHLTEDQGWRIEIDKYPELTIKGSKRSHTNFGILKHEGFYTKEDIRRVINYCHERNIIVIPEIDMPGHMQAAIACYPFLSCFDRKLPVATHWGVKHDILCAGKEKTYEFIRDIIDEVIELFPDKYIHLGGDEAVKTRWKLCPHCQKKIKELGLKDENQLQAYFINTISDYIKSKGYQTIIWNEYDFSEICDIDIIWQIWNPDERIFGKIKEDSKLGRRYINSNSEPYYLDLTYEKNSLKRVYEYNPYIDKNDENLLGLEVCLWSEFVRNIKKAEKMTFPRITAFAENAWTDAKLKDYGAYMERLTAFYEYLDTCGINYKYPIKKSNPNKIKGLIEKAWFGRRIFYWAGLHNEIDNLKVKLKYKNQKGNQNG